ncbi:hypothetical protein [Streptomyces sp. NPDC050704]
MALASLAAGSIVRVRATNSEARVRDQCRNAYRVRLHREWRSRSPPS